MARSSSNDNPTTSGDATAYQTTYTTEQAPNLPDANVVTTRPDPLIDTKLIEIRNAEAQANADRVSK